MRFDAFAETYDEHSRPQQSFAVRVGAFARVASGTRILELGAGTGALTRELCAVSGVEVHATDSSPAMVRLGKNRVPAAQWSVLDAFHEPIPESALQVSSGLLQWADDPALVLRRWREGLGQSGLMAHAFPCEPCLAEWRALVDESPLVWRSPDSWLEVFSKSGLRVKRNEVWIERHYFASALEMLRSLHRSGVTGRAKVSAARLRRAMQRYEAQHRCAEGIYATWAWMAVEAVRRD